MCRCSFSLGGRCSRRTARAVGSPQGAGMHDARAGIECEVRGIGRGGIGQYRGERGFPIGKNPAASMLIDRGNLKRGEEQARECWPPGWSPPCRRPPPACPTVSTRIDCRPHRPQRSPAPPRPGAPRVGLGDLSQASPRCPALLLASASSPPSHHRPRRHRPPQSPSFSARRPGGPAQHGRRLDPCPRAPRA